MMMKMARIAERHLTTEYLLGTWDLVMYLMELRYQPSRVPASKVGGSCHFQLLRSGRVIHPPHSRVIINCLHCLSPASPWVCTAIITTENSAHDQHI